MNTVDMPLKSLNQSIYLIRSTNWSKQIIPFNDRVCITYSFKCFQKNYKQRKKFKSDEAIFIYS